MYSQHQLLPFADEDVAGIDVEAAKETELVCNALLDLQVRSNMGDERLAMALNVDPETMRRILLGQVLGQPTLSFVLHFVAACGGRLKIGLGRGAAIVI